MEGGGGGGVLGEGVRQLRGQAAIMMCGCDGGCYSGYASLKSIYAWIRVMSHRF
jgi:hypothetical protein